MFEKDESAFGPKSGATSEKVDIVSRLVRKRIIFSQMWMEGSIEASTGNHAPLSTPSIETYEVVVIVDETEITETPLALPQIAPFTPPSTPSPSPLSLIGCITEDFETQPPPSTKDMPTQPPTSPDAAKYLPECRLDVSFNT